MTDREAFDEWLAGYKKLPFKTTKAAMFVAWQAAIAVERERCAQAFVDLDKQKWFPSQRDFAAACADAIRKGE